MWIQKYYAVLLILAPVIEALHDGYQEIVNKTSPDYLFSNLLRVLWGCIFLSAMVITGIATITPAKTVIFAVLLILSYSVILDFSLNLLRNLNNLPRKYYYLGNTSDLDKLQVKFLGAKFWFWFKVTASGVLIVLFELL